MKTSRLFAAALVLGLFGVISSAAFGEDDRMARIEQRFKAADKDGDGKLTREEAEAGMPRVAKNFDKLDKDHKGYVTLDEIKAAVAAMGAHKQD